ncbi:hypothetical protein JXJ21_09655 [candidate division KSB1 bacterium]|nr:hypothetical protein [candidate division KSB1 bacterium]
MTTRERFNRVLHWQQPDHVPNMDFGYWEQTFTEWHKQGLPEHIDSNVKAEHYFGLEGTDSIPSLPIDNGMRPGFKHKILEDKGDHQIIQDGSGVICEVFKKDASIPRYIKFPIETRQDWERFRDEQLDYKDPNRIGKNLKAAVDEAHRNGMPIRFNGGSLYGWIRNWMGVENLSYALMNEKDLVEEMMEHLTQMTLYLAEKTLPGLEVDVAWWWEDMCYNHGPLLSPKLFEELMVPRYKRITDALKKYGIDVNILDCDGNIHELVPGWLRGGINCMFPLEAAHTDSIKIREEYGKDVLLIGAVNKVELSKGKESIDREVERLAPLVDEGGFIPTVDHRVPPDVSLKNYRYYLEKKQEIL